MIIKNGLVALKGNDKPIKLDLRIKDEKIFEIGKNFSHHEETIDATGLYILPGAIDPHVHFNDPGFTYNEEFDTGSAFAASGGVTTIIDMPCTSIPPVTNIKNLNKKLKVIGKKSYIDYGLFGGIDENSLKNDAFKNIKELAPKVLGFKCYFISGMKTFKKVNHYELKKILEYSKLLKIPILLHAEDFDYISNVEEEALKAGKFPEHYYKSRPETAEVLAISAALEIAEEVMADLHIVHISTARGAELLKGRKHVTGETAPHYLEFTLKDFSRIGSALKVTPPIKRPGNKELLWNYLEDGTLNFVASDHAPSPLKNKNTGSIWTDYGGLPGVGTLLPYMFSEGYVKGRLSLSRLLEVTSERAAKRYSIYNQKGSIEIGKDADLVFIDPKAKYKVEGKKFLSKGKITPFEGKIFYGKIMKTFLRGTLVYDNNKGMLMEKGFGKLVIRDEA